MGAQGKIKLLIQYVALTGFAMTEGSSCLTIFGLLHDASEREVHILFSSCPGYVRCIVVPGKDYRQKPYAFVQFDSQENAIAAMDSRQVTTWEEDAKPVSIEISKRD